MIENIEYNTEREFLIIPEYGRHVQKMINHATSRETKEERNKLAKAIISVMGNMQPHLRDVPDFQHKLWDQLFIMSDFKTIFTKLTEYGCDVWAVMEWECCIKSPEQGAREGAPFIQSHIIEATQKTFDDFAGGSIDDQHLRNILNL